MIDLVYIDQTPPIFFLIGSSYEIMDRCPLGKGEETFLISLISYYQLCKKNQTYREKPAIGVEPMTLALQMRCSNL